MPTKEKKDKKSSKPKSKSDKPKRSSSRTKESKEKVKTETGNPISLPAGRDTNPTIDFEAGRFFERADTRGTLDQTEFQRLWRAARTGEALQPPTNTIQSISINTTRQRDVPPLDRRFAPPPSDLPLPTDFSAGGYFERFDTNMDGHISFVEFSDLMFEWSRDKDFPRNLANLSDMRGLFERFDLDGDGYLSRGDFLQLVASVSRGLSTATLRTPSPLRTDNEYTRYSWFDETVGVAVTVDGAEAARNAAHQVVPLTDAFEQRMAKLQEQLAVNLLPKRSRLQAQLSTIRGQIDEVQSARNMVEKETVADCDAIIDRLRSLEAVRVAPLVQAASEVDSELLSIDRLKKYIESSFVDKGHTGKVESMLRLIHNYPDLLHNVERIAARLNPTLKSLDQTVCDFPREVKNRVDCMARESKYEEALAVKDRMLWEILQERKDLEEKLKEEQSLCHEYSNEMSSWVELTDKLSREVSHLRALEAHSKELEGDFEKMMERVQDDHLELQLLRSQRKDFAELMEENCALRQQLGNMEKKFRTLRLRETSIGNTESRG